MTPELVAALARLEYQADRLAMGRLIRSAYLADLALVAADRIELERLLLAVRRDHMADNDCTVNPCAWCEDLIAILPDAQMPSPEVRRAG